MSATQTNPASLSELVTRFSPEQRELLLAKLARCLVLEHGDTQTAIIRDEKGVVGYFLPVSADNQPPLREDSPEFQAEMKRRLEAPPEPLLSPEVVTDFLNTIVAAKMK